MDTLDILYLHWPARFKIIDKTLEAMNKLVKQEKIRYIAVSNYTTKHLDKALSLSESHIIANQVEMHPWLQQKELLSHHKKKNVHVVAYFPLMHGKFKQVPDLMQIAEKIRCQWSSSISSLDCLKRSNTNT